MNQFFEISGKDVAELNDSNLRELIGLLCEAECRSQGISPSSVLWSGHQDAKDGGIDVAVESKNVLSTGFIPKPKTGFQVKKPDMTPAAIINEMKPQGKLRDSIKTLIESEGSYIIVSSQTSATDTALKARLKAMRDAVISEVGDKDITLDFYDQGRVATWVRTHPSIILWVRNRIGRTLKGWQAFGNWSHPGKEHTPYIIDDKVRLYNGTRKVEDAEISIEEGLDEIRSILAQESSCVRLAGLSGVGKTRFIQALFDESIGKNALNQSLVLYTDQSNGPEPDARTLAELLIAQGTRNILVVDNCPPDTHRKLVEVCSDRKGKLSLITVEYDVREDLPEETQVFRLEPSSDELIVKLVNDRFKHISNVDARTIANFSGGNARVAIVLAGTVQLGETLSSFQNEELFERLFWQRQNANLDLMTSAQVLSLVYSFDGTGVQSQSELSLLASLIGKSASSIYANVAELRSRDLIQSRGIWRAMLPHAIANRLARKALEGIPIDTIHSMFINSGSERLVRSFTRRLNFLHDCDAAVKIASAWLSEDGWLGNVNNLNGFGMDIFENLSPVVPFKALEAIERASAHLEFTTRSNYYHYKFVRLLRLLAFDEEMFLRSTRVISQFALNESPDEKSESTKDVLKSLFSLYLSGTHALKESRYILIEELMNTTDTNKHNLALILLKASLEASHFQTLHSFDFGARSRDYGYSPKTYLEQEVWFSFFIRKTVEIFFRNNSSSFKALEILFGSFRGLWTRAGMYDELETAIQEIKRITTGNEGWVEVRSVLYFDKEKMDETAYKRLQVLSKLIEPKSLIEQVRTYVLHDRLHTLSYISDSTYGEEVTSSSLTKIEELIINLGMQLAQSDEDIDTIAAELLSTPGAGLWLFGRGLARNSHNKIMTWERLKKHVTLIEIDKRNFTLMVGFVHETALSQSEISGLILDEVLVDPMFMEFFPNFQIAATVDIPGLKRLQQSLAINKAPVFRYQSLAYGRNHETISDDALAELLLVIASKENGMPVALEILHMRFYQTNANQHTKSLIAAGQTILMYSIQNADIIGTSQQHNIKHVAEICLEGDEAQSVVIAICRSFINDVNEYKASSIYYSELLGIVAQKNPETFLNIVVESEAVTDEEHRYKFWSYFKNDDNPLNHISDDYLIRWCKRSSHSRFKLLAGLVDGFTNNHNTQELEWKPIIKSMLDDPCCENELLYQLGSNIRPTSWSGSLAHILQTRLILFKSLFNHKNVDVSSWAKQWDQILQEQIIRERKDESFRARVRDESFE